jgi:ectoine hydroxylase-related dioxygenase (phytanoyl-CoA dioxygenase family)
MDIAVRERWSARIASRLEDDGYVRLPGALDRTTVERLTEAVDEAWRHRRGAQPSTEGDPLHLLAFLREDTRFLSLLDHRPVLDVLVESLGTNIFMYHCHLDVHPPRSMPTTTWMWHQDGGVQNRDLETTPRPRLSIKVAYFLTDVSEPGRGNFIVLPGSHRRNSIDRPPDGTNDLPGAVPILAEPGDAVLFDRRLWHMRGDNASVLTRKALFLAYTYRWIRPRDELALPASVVAMMTPAQRQLAGVDTDDPIRFWMPDREPPVLSRSETA